MTTTTAVILKVLHGHCFPGEALHSRRYRGATDARRRIRSSTSPNVVTAPGNDVREYTSSGWRVPAASSGNRRAPPTIGKAGTRDRHSAFSRGPPHRPSTKGRMRHRQGQACFSLLDESPALYSDSVAKEMRNRRPYLRWADLAKRKFLPPSLSCGAAYSPSHPTPPRALLASARSIWRTPSRRAVATMIRLSCFPVPSLHYSFPGQRQPHRPDEERWQPQTCGCR